MKDKNKCMYCNKKIHFWQTVIVTPCGNYHRKCRRKWHADRIKSALSRTKIES